MVTSRSAKPLVSIALALLAVLALNLPFLSTESIAGPSTPFDVVQAGAIHYGIIGALLGLWLLVQLFWKAPTEATKLGLAASATIFWLALTLFFDLRQESIGGAVAFFALVGGLGVVLLWTRYLSDEVTF